MGNVVRTAQHEPHRDTIVARFRVVWYERPLGRGQSRQSTHAFVTPTIRLRSATRPERMLCALKTFCRCVVPILNERDETITQMQIGDRTVP
jgi:hypothetical protein